MSEHKVKKQGRSRPRRWRVWAFAAIVVAVLGVVLMGLAILATV